MPLAMASGISIATRSGSRSHRVFWPTRGRIAAPNDADSASREALPVLDMMRGGEELEDGAEKAPKIVIWTEETRALYNKTVEDGKVHVTSINSSTGQRSICRLQLPEKRLHFKINTLSRLPEEAKEALKAALQDCNQHPKRLQHVADQLSEKLLQRRFPASPGEVRAARRKVFDEIEENDLYVTEMLRSKKLTPFYRKMIYEKAQRILKRDRYNWEPLKFKKKEDAAVFALSRLAPYYAEIQRVFNEFDRNNFVPETVLDYGSGIGSAFWVTHKRWGDKIKEYTVVEPQWPIRNFSMDIMRGSNYSTTGELVNKNVYFRRNLAVSASKTFDLVIVHRTLIEMPSKEERVELIRQLWKRTNRYLVIIESPLSGSFKAVQEARDLIIREGYELDFGVVKQALDERNLLDRELIEKLGSKRVSPHEKFRMVQSMLPDNFVVPTKMHPGFVYAPCPHDEVCPKIRYHKGLTPCKFQVRWLEVRSDHKTRSANHDGTETGQFTYVIMEKGHRPKGVMHPSRILEKANAGRCVECKVCTQHNDIQQFTVSARSGPIYKRVRFAKASQLLPVKNEIVKTEIELLPFVDAAAPNDETDATTEEARRIADN